MGSAYEIKQEDAAGTILSKLAGPELDDVDGTALVYLPGNILKIDLSALATANDIVAVQNPYGVDVIIKNAVIRVKTAGGTANAVLDVDVVDGATDTGDDIFDGIGRSSEYGVRKHQEEPDAQHADTHRQQRLGLARRPHIPEDGYGILGRRTGRAVHPAGRIGQPRAGDRPRGVANPRPYRAHAV